MGFFLKENYYLCRYFAVVKHFLMKHWQQKNGNCVINITLKV